MPKKGALAMGAFFLYLSLISFLRPPWHSNTATFTEVRLGINETIIKRLSKRVGVIFDKSKSTYNTK